MARVPLRWPEKPWMKRNLASGFWPVRDPHEVHRRRVLRRLRRQGADVALWEAWQAAERFRLLTMKPEDFVRLNGGSTPETIKPADGNDQS